MDGLVLHADLPEPAHHFRIGDGGGIADVADDLYLSLAVFDHIGGEGELACLVLKLGEAELVLKEAFNDILHLRALLLEEAQDGEDGVLAELGRGTVRRRAVRGELFIPDLQPHLAGAGEGERAGRRRAFVAHHIGARAALQKEERRFFAHGEVQPDVQNTLLRIDDGETSVGRETLGGHFGDLVIVLDARPAALLVAADDEFYLPRGDKPLVFERLHGIKNAHRGTFVVDGAPAPDLPVRDFSAEGGFRPPAPRGNNVEVGEDGERLALAEYNFSHIVAVIFRLKSERLRKREKVCEAVRTPLAERKGRGALGRRGIKADALGDTLHGLLKIISHNFSPL